jgi:hypothetical protein
MTPANAMAKFHADIDRHRHLFDLDRNNLGQDLCKAATDGVQATIAAEESPDGTHWDKLSPAYEDWKSYQFPGEPIAVLYQVMANPHEVAGEVVVTTLEATVTYGITEQARREAQWFQEGDADQPPRPFWGLTTAGVADSKKILDARFATI